MRLSMPFSDAFAAWFDVGYAAGVAAVFTAGFKARPPVRLYEGGAPIVKPVRANIILQ